MRKNSEPKISVPEIADKGEIRKRSLALRDAMASDAITEKSGEIVRRLMNLREIREASTLMVFLSFGSEVLTDDLIARGLEAGKIIAVPLCRPRERMLIPCRITGFDDLEKGHYGIREPKAGCVRPVLKDRIDTILVPAVAFDRHGRRIGYGGGYYDRFLPTVPEAVRIGVVFACQIVDEIRPDLNDVPVDRIVTEDEIIGPFR